MVRILSVGVLKNLLRQDDEALRKAGFSISLCNGPVRAKRLLGRPDRYDMLLIGQAIPPKHRNWLLEYVKQTSPGTRICSVPEADPEDALPSNTISTDTSPGAMVTTLRRLAEEVLAENTTISGPELALQDTKILYVASTPALALLRRDQLKEAGYDAQASASVQEVELACNQESFHLVVISPALGPRVKLRLAGAVRQRQPGAQILETGTAIPAIEGANSSLGVSGPELLRAIAHVVRHRPANFSRSKLHQITN